MIFLHSTRHGGEFLPMKHLLILSPHLGMTVLYILRYQFASAFTRMEDNAATEIACQSCQMFHPSIESRFKLHPRPHSPLYASYRVKRLLYAAHHNLPAYLTDKSLGICSPERVARRCLAMETHDYLTCLIFLEGMFDTVGYICG